MLICLCLLLAWFARSSRYLSEPTKASWLLVAFGLVAAAVYFVAVWAIPKSSPTRRLLIWVIAVGAILRLAMFSTPPILDDDVYRYLWDGAVVANGFNPYAYAPNAFLDENADTLTPNRLRKLAGQAEKRQKIISRINFPELRSIYPPIAQAAFALAYWLDAWSVDAWRVVLLIFDIVNLCLLAAILRQVRRSPLWLVIYWWNPILIKEVFNSAHMEVVTLPFVLAAVLLSMRKNHVFATISLALAVGAKVWPIILLPLLLRPLLAEPKKLVLILPLFAVLIAAMCLPIYVTGLDDESGFTAYSLRWQNNSSIYRITYWAAKSVFNHYNWMLYREEVGARRIVVCFLAFWTIWVARRPIIDGRDLSSRALITIAAVFLIGPTAFPWYYIWFMPFLVIAPRSSLLLLTAMLPLYYLRHYFYARGSVDVFDYGIVWVEFVPVWALLIREWYLARRTI